MSGFMYNHACPNYAALLDGISRLRHETGCHCEERLEACLPAGSDEAILLVGKEIASLPSVARNDTNLDSNDV